MAFYYRREELTRHDMVRLSRDLRLDMTAAERHLWRLIRGARCGGFKFRRQHPVGSYIVDFYCPQARLVIEIDGDTHDPKEDTARDEVLSDYGLKVLRYKNRDVFDSTAAILEQVLKVLKERTADFPSGTQPQDSPPGLLP